MVVGTQDLAWSSYARSLRLRKRSVNTIKSYGFTYQQLSKWAGKPAVELSRPEIEEWLVERLDLVSEGRVSQDTLNLKIFYKWAVVEGFVETNPMEAIPLGEVETVPRRVMSDAELKAIITACKGKEFRDIRDMAIVRILCEVGTPRLGELIGMTVDSVDFGHDLLRLTGKTGTRYIPIGDKSAQALERYLRVRKNHRCSALEGLWLGKMGRMGRGGFQELIKRRAALAGIQGSVFPHLFRHATASRASEAGISDSLLEPLYGWADGSAMPRVYGAATRIHRAQNASRRLALGDQL